MDEEYTMDTTKEVELKWISCNRRSHLQMTGCLPGNCELQEVAKTRQTHVANLLTLQTYSHVRGAVSSL